MRVDRANFDGGKSLVNEMSWVCREERLEDSFRNKLRSKAHQNAHSMHRLSLSVHL